MPIYEYKCPACEAQLEKRQQMSADPPNCAKCAELGNEVVMKKMVSQGSFHLKGGGWYSDGYSG